MTDVMRLMPVQDEEVTDAVCKLLHKHNLRGIALVSATKITSKLNVDSVEIMDLVMEIEQEFDIDIPINMLSDVETIGDLVEVVGNRVRGR